MLRTTADWNGLAERVIDGHATSADEALALLESPDDELLAVMHAAFRVRSHHFGNIVNVHVLQNAKSGACPEDCSFCSQSAHFSTGVPEYGLQTPTEIIDGAREAHRKGAVTYCIVTATRGPSDADLDGICRAVTSIKAELPLRICTSLGMLGPGQAERLAAAGVDRYNHNLETSRSYFGNICTTHGWDERADTIRAAKAAGMEACCGGILGMGETPADRVGLAIALRELDVESVPVNFLDPRTGTPEADRPKLRPSDCLRALAMFRMVHPDRDVRAAGGREACLGAMQPMALFAANSIFTDGYLTTPGQEPSDDWRMIVDAGFRPAVVEG